LHSAETCAVEESPSGIYATRRSAAVKELGRVIEYFKIREKEIEKDILFRTRAGKLVFPFAAGM
jgi:hypothetical protein